MGPDLVICANVECTQKERQQPCTGLGLGVKVLIG